MRCASFTARPCSSGTNRQSDVIGLVVGHRSPADTGLPPSGPRSGRVHERLGLFFRRKAGVDDASRLSHFVERIDVMNVNPASAAAANVTKNAGGDLNRCIMRGRFPKGKRHGWVRYPASGAVSSAESAKDRPSPLGNGPHRPMCFWQQPQNIETRPAFHARRAFVTGQAP